MAEPATREIDDADVLHRLSTLDRFLPVWILLAMAAGLFLGWALPAIQDVLDAVKVGQTSLPIAIGLLLMMYPVLAKVHYEDMSHVTGDKPLLWHSLVLNWLVGPALMFTLAWVFLHDYPEFRTGLIVIGLARCIAMVLIWNDLACGDREAAALLVAINSVFQVVAYALLGTFYLEVLPGWLGLPTEDVTFSTADITRSVLIFLGIPLLAGFMTRRILRPRMGADWYDNTFLPRLGPWALYGLLFTIVVMFALQGEAILGDPLSVVLIAVPLLVYFALMWGVSFALGVRARLGYPEDGHAGVHGGRQQLRARDRGVDRGVGGHQRAGAGRRDRPADRGPRPGGPRVRLPLAAPSARRARQGRGRLTHRHGRWPSAGSAGPPRPPLRPRPRGRDLRPLWAGRAGRYSSMVVESTVVEATHVEASSAMTGADAAAQLLAVAADPVRWRLLNHLADNGTSCVCDLNPAAGVAPNVLSYHLKVLREAGLVTWARRGRWIDYTLAPEAADRLAQALPGRAAQRP